MSYLLFQEDEHGWAILSAFACFSRFTTHYDTKGKPVVLRRIDEQLSYPKKQKVRANKIQQKLSIRGIEPGCDGTMNKVKRPIEESIQSSRTRFSAKKHHCSEGSILAVTKKPETRGIHAT